MSFSKNKEGNKNKSSNTLSESKKYSSKIYLGLIVVCIIIISLFVGYLSKDENEEIVASDLNVAISQAIISNNEGGYKDGETVAEGHIILGTSEESENIVIYALTTYGEYGFENNIFTKISGTGIIPTRIEFNKDNDGYSLVEYIEPKDGSKYMESIKEMFPKNLVNKAINPTDSDTEKCHEQEYQYANEYLTSINRMAEVNLNVDKKLDNMNTECSNTFIDLYHEYPYWIGTQEKIEHNVRFVYEKQWKDKGNGNGIVTFKKYKYDDNETVEEYVIEIEGEQVTYLKGEERTTRNQNSIAKEVNLGETVKVDLDGDGKLENIYYSLEDFRINGVSYRKDIEDVYLNFPNQNSFIIVDLDKKDNQKEIVLKVEGSSDDPVAHFYAYKNGLIKLGKAETELNYTSFDGEGNFYGNVRLDILQTWFAPETWSLNDNKIVRNTNHIYYPNQYVGSKVILKEELPIQENLTDSNETIIVKPQEVKITRTDNEKFCYLEAEDGTAGWFEVTDFYKIVELDNEIATNVFEGLCMAD